MYKVIVEPERGITATYDINTDNRALAIVKAQGQAMKHFNKEYGTVRLVSIEKTVPAATETANLHPVFENILQNYCTTLGGK